MSCTMDWFLTGVFGWCLALLKRHGCATTPNLAISGVFSARERFWIFDMIASLAHSLVPGQGIRLFLHVAECGR